MSVLLDAINAELELAEADLAAASARAERVRTISAIARGAATVPIEASAWPEQVDDAPPCVWPPAPSMADDEPEANEEDESVAHRWTRPPSLALAPVSAKPAAPKPLRAPAPPETHAEIDAKVMAVIVAYPQTIGAICNAVNEDSRSVSASLGRLVADGAVAKGGTKRGTRYSLPAASSDEWAAPAETQEAES
jgi:hypothetical protein